MRAGSDGVTDNMGDCSSKENDATGTEKAGQRQRHSDKIE